MGNLHPYLQRRGNHFFFRISVPTALRPVVGVREFTTTLKTSDRAAAVPLALELGATAHRLFRELTTDMNNKDTVKLLADARMKLRIGQVQEEMQDHVDEAHRLRIATIHEAKKASERASREAALMAEVRALRDAMAVIGGRSAQTPLPQPTPFHVEKSAPEPAYPLLAAVIDAFLADYAKDKKPAMFKKQKPALDLLRELHGAQPLNQLKQKDLADYFKVVHGLPPRWAEKCKKRGMSARALALEEHPERLGKKTFDDNYEVPIRLFLRWARFNWQDQGFPTALTTEGVEFKGKDNEGRKKQRAMTRQELEQLFHRELAPVRNDENQAHKWWLPALGFYTGARVNELCQVNPQTDIGVSPEGINYLLITDETEGDERVRKSVKTKVPRHVPLHPELIERGFLAYVDRVRRTGAKLLFPAWNPTNERASTQAEDWFRDLLRDAGLRDETPRAHLVGFHAFRSTLLAMAANSQPPVDAGPITGHAAPEKSSVQRGYEGELSLPRKLDRLVAIQFLLHPCRDK